MNINTASLLNMLAPKLTTQTKSIIEGASKDGKVDVTNLLKDSSVKTILSGLFQDLAVGDKSKANVSDILKNNKPMFDLKALKSDIQNILKSIQDNPKMEKQVSVLKQFQLDIKNLDEKVLKSNISNSGVFLESKLANKEVKTPIPYNVKVAMTQIQELEEKVSNMTKDIKAVIKNILGQTSTNSIPLNKAGTPPTITTTTPAPTPTQNIAIKVENLVNNIKQLLLSPTPDTKVLASNIKELTTLTQSNPKLTTQTVVLKDISLKLSNPIQTLIPSKNEIVNMIKQPLVDIVKAQEPTTIKDLATHIKESIKNPTVDTKSLATNVKNLSELLQPKTLSTTLSPTVAKQIVVLKDVAIGLNNLNPTQTQTTNLNANMNINVVKSNLINTLQQPLNDIIKTQEQPKTQIQTQTATQSTTTNTTPIKNTVTQINNLTTQLKDLTSLLQSTPKLEPQITALKDIIGKLTTLNQTPNPTETNTNIKMKVITALSQPLETISENSKQTKAQIQTVLTADTKNVSNESKILLTQIQSNPKLEKQTALIKEFVTNTTQTEIKAVQNQTAMPKIQADIKATLLQIQERIDTKIVDVPKEIKAQVDKVLGQIEFYQLSSYTSQSNHTYLPFDWEDIEDATVEFKTTKKESFSCHIGLTLKNHGDINAMLLLDIKNNININIGVQEESLKLKIQDKLQLLRQGINKIGLNLQSLNVLDIQDPKKQTYEQKAYGNNTALSFGLDVKA